MTLPGISVAIITKNEEDCIRRCLESVSWAQDIVVADTGSTDRTVAICREMGCRVVEPGWHGFGKTKQICVDQTACDWVLSLDADEVVSEGLRQCILGLDLNPHVAAGFHIRRQTFYLGRLIRFSGWKKDYPLRLFNRNYGRFSDDMIHEQVQIQGDAKRLEPCLFHHSYPDLATHMEKMNLYSRLGAEKLAARGKTCGIIKPVLRGLFKFIRMYVLEMGFLDGKHGLVLACVSAFGVSLKYFKLWEMTVRAR
ncbi:MAG: glycosyltransferase family 2 protein [Pseudomonadota bacterium]